MQSLLSIVFSLCSLILIQNDVTGVDFKDCKAKKGECEKCSGAGGKITIEGTCVPEEYSCDGLKVEKMAKDCVEYCGTGKTKSCK